MYARPSHTVIFSLLIGAFVSFGFLSLTFGGSNGSEPGAGSVVVFQSLESKAEVPSELTFSLGFQEGLESSHQLFFNAIELVSKVPFGSTQLVALDMESSEEEPDFEILVSNTTADFKLMISELQAEGYLVEDIDALTITTANGARKVVFLADRLQMLGVPGRRLNRPMVFGNIVVAAAKELYGNIAGALTREELVGVVEPVDEQIRQEVKTHRIGIQFIEALLKDGETSEHKLPEKLRGDLGVLLQREKTALADWGEVKASGKVVESCDLALRRKKKKAD